jgi:hypothetical protein
VGIVGVFFFLPKLRPLCEFCHFSCQRQPLTTWTGKNLYSQIAAKPAYTPIILQFFFAKLQAVR